jgi:hypothetical protein
MLIHEDPEGPPDGPGTGACGAPPDDAPSQDKLQLPRAVALERDDLRTQGGWKKRAEKTASDKTPVAGVKDMGSQVIRLPQGTDACAQKPPCETARNGDRPASALHGHGASDDVLLPQIPCIPAWICISFCPDTVRPRRDDTVNNALNLSRRGKDDHIPLPHLFDTAGDETDPVPRPEQRAHALAPAEEHVPVFLTRSDHAIFIRGPGPISPQRVYENCFPFSYKRPRPLDPRPFQCIPKNSPEG